tara:strand:+ start:1174 stop:2370 length:1197 start_codon:yes stop_codon:yes gene_type:complete
LERNIVSFLYLNQGGFLEPFKLVFNEQLVDAFALCISRCDDSFDVDGFKQAIIPTLDKLELKARSNLIADSLHRFLPENSDEREGILFSILHPDGHNNDSIISSEDGITGWGTLPMASLVGEYGVGDFSRSMNALKVMTGHFSSEFAIRFLILKDSEQALSILLSWLTDQDKHVRRLISEGTRPRLPWAMQLPEFIAKPEKILPLLLSLRDDQEEYVRRSVANNLNDIAKDHPDLVANIAVEWMHDVHENRLDKTVTRNRERLVRHACRTLIKQGHATALSAFGLNAPKLESSRLLLSSQIVKFGDSLEFELSLQSNSETQQKLVIDYVIHFKKANGKTSPKVFKGSKQTLPANGSLTIKRKHAIKAITTRTYYAGEHFINLRVNGQDYPECPFSLVI